MVVKCGIEISGVVLMGGDGKINRRVQQLPSY